MTTTNEIVSVRGLSVEVASGRRIVNDVSLGIAPGKILGLVGQSGSGKTTVAMSLLGYARHGAHVVEGSISVAGHDVREMSQAALRELRGSTVSYVPQDPRASLNPALRIREQIGEVLEFGASRLARPARLEEVRLSLEEVGLPTDDEFLGRFPHQLSGGQLQRVGIAAAIAGRPDVIVLDEPTTGLDVKTQRRILDLVRHLCTRYDIAGLYVTHDLAAIAQIADDILVLNYGRVVEHGPISRVFRAPAEEYTERLLAASPDIAVPGGGTTSPGPEERARGLVAHNITGGYRRNLVLHDVSFEVAPGECLALVGESGSGKSTLSRAAIGLHHDYTGRFSWRGDALSARASRRSTQQVRELQYIFQSPYNALNPRATVRESIAFAQRVTRARDKKGSENSIDAALLEVGLDPSIGDQLPNRLSGGERQRVAIARALITQPDLLICDEVTSALDVLVQAEIIELLRKLRREQKLAMLFVTHDLALVRSFADRVIVLEGGSVVEAGTTEQVLGAPQHPYTRSLVANTLSIHEALNSRDGAAPGAVQLGSVASAAASAG